MNDEKLFEMEERILKAAVDEVSNSAYVGNILLPGYKVLTGQYRKLLKFTQKIFSISDIQGEMLQLHQEQIKNLLDNANQGFLTFGADLRVDRQYSAKCRAIFGRDIFDFPVECLLAEEDQEQERIRAALAELFASVTPDAEQLRALPVLFQIGGKEIRAEYKLIRQTENKREVTVVMAILTDITEEVKAQEEIRFLSYLSRHDPLTSLCNRTELELVLPDLERQENFPVSVIMADINGLKLTNDVFGHYQGDLLLLEMAKILTQVCRKSDVVIRWGGDEFIVLLPRTNRQNARKICRRIQETAARSRNCVFPVSAAIGVATQTDGEPFCFVEQMAAAESEMYADKLLRSKETRDRILSGLEAQLVKKGLVGAGHGERLTALLRGFFAHIGEALSATDGELLRKLVVLHDIGKLAIAAEDVPPPEGARPSPWETMRSESETGYRMAEAMGERSVAELILVLQARWDGKGYPADLRGEDIPLFARVFALAEAYDMLTHHPHCRVMLSRDDALREIELQAGQRFDPNLAARFEEFVRAAAL